MMLMQRNLAQVDTTATVHETAVIGEGTTVWGNSYIGKGAKIGKHCTIGRTVEIGAGVTIGDNCKIEAGAQVHPGWTIGDNVFIGPCAVFCNDNDPQAVRGADNPFEPLFGYVWDGATICANCTIIGGITIGEKAKVWPGAVVTKSIPEAHSAVIPAAENKLRFVPDDEVDECIQQIAEKQFRMKQIENASKFIRLLYGRRLAKEHNNLSGETEDIIRKLGMHPELRKKLRYGYRGRTEAPVDTYEEQLAKAEARLKRLENPSWFACGFYPERVRDEYNGILDEIDVLRKKLGLPMDMRLRMAIR